MMMGPARPVFDTAVALSASDRHVAARERLRHEVRARAGAEIARSVADVGAHGVVRDGELRGDLRAAGAERDEMDDLPLASRQALAGGRLVLGAATETRAR